MSSQQQPIVKRNIYLVIRCAECNKKLGNYKGKTFFIQHARDSSRIVCAKCWKRLNREQKCLEAKP